MGLRSTRGASGKASSEKADGVWPVIRITFRSGNALRQRGAQGSAVENGHRQIRQHQVEVGIASQAIEGVLAILGERDQHAVQHQQSPDRVPDTRVIVDDENPQQGLGRRRV